MSTPASRKTYTRRNTRTRLIDLLKEAIELVEKGCPPGHMTRGPASVLPLPATAATAMPATAATAMPANVEKAPLSAIAEEDHNLVTKSRALLAASQLQLEKGRELERQAQEILKSQAVPKTKGTVRPGVLRYNEFVKDWISKHPEYQAKGKYQAALKEIQRSGNWNAVSGTRKKAKASVAPTPGRVNAKVPLAAPANANNNNSTATPVANANAANANAENANAANANAANANAANANAANAANANAANAANANAANAANANAANANANSSLSYTNEGMNDTVGMRKISMNGRNLYLSSDDGVFERDGNSPGDFIGRLVDGKLVEEEAPELPEYS